MTTIYDIFSNLIDALRNKATIMSITDNTDNTYTIQLNSLNNTKIDLLELKEGDFVGIENTPNFNAEYEIISITDKSITIAKESGAVISNLGIVNGLKPFFSIAKTKEEANKILHLGNNKDKSKMIFPRFVLILDLSENVNLSNGYSTANAKIWIVERTLPNEISEWRIDTILKEKLYPLFQIFIGEIRKGKYFLSSEISKTDRIFLGSGSTNQNTLNQYVEALELDIKNIRYFVKQIC